MTSDLDAIREARTLLDAAEADLRRLVIAAHRRRDAAVAAIAEAAGVKRQTVYTWAALSTAEPT